MCKSWILHYWFRYDQKFVCWDNSGQNIWNKVKKSSNVRQELEDFDTSVLFDCYCQCLISVRETEQEGMPALRLFSYFFNFLKF